MSVATTTRRVGAATSKTRDAVLDAVEGLLRAEGYPGVTYRAVACTAGITPSLVQYYFPTLDSLFTALMERLVNRDIDGWTAALRERPGEPLRVLWEHSRSEGARVLGMELMALGNHRPAVGTEIAAGTTRIREIQLAAISAKYGDDAMLDGRFSPEAMVLLLTSVPKYLSLEDGIDVDVGHRCLVEACETYLDSIEPRATDRRERGPAALPRC